MTTLSTVEGIGPTYSKRLHQAGIGSMEGLLKQCSSPRGRLELSKRSGISEHLLLKWANRADLCRIRGIGEEYSDLLEASGVDTVPELAQRNPQHLLTKMHAVNDQKHLVRRCPSANDVKFWVAQAKKIPRVINY